MNMDTVYNGIDIGTLDTNLNISNITQSKGGLEKTDTFIIKKPSRGYHLITGIIRILGIDSIRNTYEKDIVFYHDFYVLPK